MNKKLVAISVLGGVAEVESNEYDVRVGIVDYDNEEVYEDIIDGSEEVVIIVRGGVAYDQRCNDDIELVINDYDNERC